MEEWQKAVIIDNFPALINSTSCTPNLLASLRSKKILGGADVQAIESRETPLDKAMKLYEILCTRINGYGALMQCLVEDTQSGPLQILYKGLVLNQSVKFQNGEMRVKDSLPAEVLPELDLDQIIPDEPFMRAWISDPRKCPPQLVKNSVPPTPSYYIPRRIFSTRRISPDVLRNPSCCDIFVVKGIRPSQLTKLVNNREIKYSSSQTKDGVNGQFILLEFDGDYDKICEIAKYPVHLLSHHEGALTWVKSSGSIARIQKHVMSHQQTEFSGEDQFVTECTSTSSPICVADTPGMGKSVVLARVGEKIMEGNPLALVQFIVFREFMRELEESVKKTISLESLCHLIANLSSDYQVGREVVLKSLKSQNVKCYLLFDGYDEVLQTQVPLANSVLEHLRGLPNTQLWVTTRPHRRRELEEALSALGYNMSPFEVTDQVNFLTRYWSEEGGAEDNEKLSSFAKLCLTNLRNNLSQYERDLMGIPLQCSLLAKLYSHHAVEYSKEKSCCSSSEVPSCVEQLQLPRNISSIFDMHHRLVELSFQRLSNSSPVVKFNNSLWERVTSFFVPPPTSLKEAILHAHMFYAIELLFPELSPKFRKLLLASSSTATSSRFHSQIYVPGMLEPGAGIDDVPRFVHRTFAEYFVALFIVKLVKLRNLKEELRQLLLELVLSTAEQTAPVFWTVANLIDSYTFHHPIVCYFLNSLLKSCQEEDGPPPRGTTTTLLPNPALLIRWITASIVHDFPCLANSLVGLFPMSTESWPWAQLWLLGAMHGSVETLSLLNKLSSSGDCDHDKLIIPSQLQYPTIMSTLEPGGVFTPLHVAVGWGRYDATVFLVSQAGFSKVPNGVLHVCAYASGADEGPIISKKRDIIQFLLDWTDDDDDGRGHQHDILHERLLVDGSTPLLVYGAHVDLLICLIDAGADIHACAHQSEDNLLHTIWRGDTTGNRVTPEGFHALVSKLSSKSFGFFGRANSSGRSPLHEAVEHLEVGSQTLELLLNLRNNTKNKTEKIININGVDKDGDSILSCAVRGGRSGRLIAQLVEHGAKLSLGHVNNSRGESVLHVAAKVGNLEAVQVLLEVAPIRVGKRWIEEFLNLVDSQGNNALHAATSHYTPQHTSIQTALIKAGISLSGANKLNYCNPFLHGLTHGRGLSLRTIKLMERHGFQLDDVDAASQGLRTLMHNLMVWEWDEELAAAAEYLIIEKGVLAPVVVVQQQPDKLLLRKSPWLETASTITIPKIAEVTEMSGLLVEKLVGMGILNETQLDKLDDGGAAAPPGSTKSQLVYNIVAGSQQEVVNSYERFMIALIASHQPQPFTMLKQVLDQVYALDNFITRFVTPPPGLVPFMEDDKAKFLQLYTSDLTTTIARIRDTVKPHLSPQVWTDSWSPPPPSGNGNNNDTVFLIVYPTKWTEFKVQTFQTFASLRKVVCIIVNSTPPPPPSRVAELTADTTSSIATAIARLIHHSVDSFTENDLSPPFLSIIKSICSKFKRGEEAEVLLFHLITHKLCHLPNPELYKMLAQKNKENHLSADPLHHIIINNNPELKMFPRNVISETVFDQLVGGDDTLGFTGIELEELQQLLSKWGQKKVVVSRSSRFRLGKSSAIIPDFILFESEGDFEWICSSQSSKQVSNNNVHLLEYNRPHAVFKLSRTHGQKINIAQHLTSNPREGVSLQKYLSEQSKPEDSTVKVVHIIADATTTHPTQLVDAMQRIYPSVIFLKSDVIVERVSKHLNSSDNLLSASHVAVHILIELFCSQEDDEIKGTGVGDPESLTHLVIFVQEDPLQADLDTLVEFCGMMKRECVNLNLWLITTTTYGGPIRWELEGALGVVAVEMRQISRQD